MDYIFQFLCMKYEFLIRCLLTFRDLIKDKRYAYLGLTYWFYSSRIMVEAEKDSPKQEGEKQPWRELVPSFSGTSAGVYEALGNIQPEYGFKHGYQSDTDSYKIETASSGTQFDMLHEDDLEEMRSLRPSDLEALRGKGMLVCLCSI